MFAKIGFTKIRTTARRGTYISALVIAGLALAACGSSATSSTATATTGTGAAAVVMTKSGPSGTYLTDGSGKTLYLFVPDGSTGKSVCTGTCAKYWPPLVTTGAPTAGAGATASMLSTFKRADGNTQVVYDGHPLYYYVSDKAAGDTTGQGLNQSGGLWWLVSPAGAAITG